VSVLSSQHVRDSVAAVHLHAAPTKNAAMPPKASRVATTRLPLARVRNSGWRRRLARFRSGHRFATPRGAVLRCTVRVGGSLSLCRCRFRRGVTVTEGAGVSLVRSSRCSLLRSRWSSRRSVMLFGIRYALAASILSPPAKSSPSSKPNTIACMRAITRAVASVTTAPAKRPSRSRYFNQNSGTSKI
jgi:hypothetical protein